MNDLRITFPHELWLQGTCYRCATGAGGSSSQRKEGDKSTPLGRFPLRECWYRADRLPTPATILPKRIITSSDGWCDDPVHPQYNQHITLPFSASHELLWREDHIYDIIVPLGFNDDPVMPGIGSAIFLHLATPDYQSTCGCIAVSLPDMMDILTKIDVSSYCDISY